MIRLKMLYTQVKEKFNLFFWRNVPPSWLYWAVITAWANATCTKFTDRHPDEVLWSDVMKMLENKRGKL
jgi:hypothetical protein